MTRSYGGVQPHLRDTTIKQQQGYLSPFIRILEPGDVQSMVFQASDIGPFWMTERDQEAKRHDRVIEGETVWWKFKKSELITHLQQHGVTAKGNKCELEKLASDRSLPLEEEVQKIDHGWEGKPKGLLQVLWEWGFVNTLNLSQYTINSKQDGFGILRHDTSLKYLMSRCQDFEEEETLLQSMGIAVDRTPKCHCELAGEGIEYSWGCSKNEYRRTQIAQKRGKEKFKIAVRKCLAREVLTTERIRKFSKRALAYICAYHRIWSEQQENQQQDERPSTDVDTATPIKVEKLVKLFKTHRCALDFDHSFCKATYTEALTN